MLTSRCRGAAGAGSGSAFWFEGSSKGILCLWLPHAGLAPFDTLLCHLAEPAKLWAVGHTGPVHTPAKSQSRQILQTLLHTITSLMRARSQEESMHSTKVAAQAAHRGGVNHQPRRQTGSSAQADDAEVEAELGGRVCWGRQLLQKLPAWPCVCTKHDMTCCEEGLVMQSR